MQTKATIASGYRWRLIIIALGSLGWAGYCVYDATIAYPNQIARRQAFVDYRDTHADWATTWGDHAIAQGWDPEEPVEKSQGDIMTQWAMFALTAPIGLYCLVLAVMWQRRFIAVDDEALYAYGDRKAVWDQITRIDAQRWDSKGIARVYYNAGSGEQAILVDDWKYERTPTTAIFNRLKEKVDASKFDGLDSKHTPADPEPASEPEENASASPQSSG